MYAIPGYVSQVNISDLYSYKYRYDEDDSYTSDNDCKYTDKSKFEEDAKIPANDIDINDDELDDNDQEDKPNLDNDNSVDNDMKGDQATWGNNINVSNNVTILVNSLDNQDPDDSDSNGVSNNCSDDSLTEDVLRARLFPCMLRAICSNRFNKGLDG